MNKSDSVSQVRNFRPLGPLVILSKLLMRNYVSMETRDYKYQRVRKQWMVNLRYGQKYDAFCDGKHDTDLSSARRYQIRGRSYVLSL